MAALPYMPLYVADYLADAAHLSTLEHGAYLLLIMTYWQKGTHLPASNERLARVARVSNEEWMQMRDTLAEFFIVTEEGWKHKRIEQELQSVKDKSEKAKAAGKASAERRLNKRSTDVQQTLNHTDTDTDINNIDVVIAREESNFNHPENADAGTSPESGRLAKWKEYWSNRGFRCKWITDANVNRLCLMLVNEGLTEDEVSAIIVETNEASRPQNVSTPCYYEVPIRKYIESKKNPRPLAAGYGQLAKRGSDYAEDKRIRKQRRDEISQELEDDYIRSLGDG